MRSVVLPAERHTLAGLAKNRERPYDLLHIVFCFATLAPAVLIRIVLSGAVEIVLNLLDMSAEAAKKFDELGKRDMQVPGSDETPSADEQAA